jgi:hypothetical protein
MTATAERARVGSGPGAETSMMSVGEFLLRRLREAGVEHAFGLPGDYNLELLHRWKTPES